MAQSLTVLVVEDSEDDALLVTRDLHRGGFDVSWERVETRQAMAKALDRGPSDLILSDFRRPRFSAPEALALARERERPIDLPLTDAVMPKPGGEDLARPLMARRPEIRVLYMSGYTDGALLQQGVLGEGVMLPEKPFTGDMLARAVREALDELAAK